MEWIEVTWGEKLGIHVDRFMRRERLNFKQLVEALASCERAVQNTWARLFTFEEAPTRATDTRRALLLLLLVGENPKKWGLGPDRPALWPPDRELRRLLRASLDAVR